MKQKNSRKLSLNKQTVTMLTESEMKEVNGGGTTFSVIQVSAACATDFTRPQVTAGCATDFTRPSVIFTR